MNKIVPQELRENAAAMAVMGYALADMPEPLPRETGAVLSPRRPRFDQSEGAAHDSASVTKLTVDS
ncbi:MAG: hypothetical protein M3P45_08950 [Acidobacteriota bacterium]|nr:hypothetical protein [Acidobacteriota bacterium]